MSAMATRRSAAQQTGPRDPATLEPVPHGRTARRVDWLLLPPAVRRLVEERFSTSVVAAHSAGSGYTPGCASVLVGADGRRMFLKAASRKAQRPFADAYAEEVRKLRALPAGLPVPRLLWSHQDDLWVLFGLEHIDGANPARPWTSTQLDLCLDTLELLADRLTPAPLPLDTFAHDVGSFLDGWTHVRRTAPHWPHLDEARGLASDMVRRAVGDSLVHTDARDDNFLITPGRAYLCDWNFPVLGPAWLDTVLLLVQAHGDGLDAEARLAERTLTRDVEPDLVDGLLALVCGYFLERRDQPVPPSSPYLRRHQDWSAQVTWDWLARRRGWEVASSGASRGR